MSGDVKEAATCRGCGRALDGFAYMYGGSAYNPQTKERAKINHYGGFVCSRTCDFRASLALEQSMPGHGSEQQRLGCYAQKSLESNWP